MRKRDVVVLGLLLFMGGLLAPVTAQSIFGRASEKAKRTKCANNLRQVSMAALQYADTKRWFPHVGKWRELDGDVHSNHTPKSMRALLWYDYIDNPETWICPSSDDAFVPVEDPDVRERMRRWFWNGDYENASEQTAPWLHGNDPALSKTTELSYGYTRRGQNRNVRSTVVIAADRAVNELGDTSPLRGNHSSGWNVVKADATVEWFQHDSNAPAGEQFVGAWLVSTSKGGGYLALKPQTDRAALATPVERRSPRKKKKKKIGGDDDEAATKTGGGCGASCALEDDASMALDALLLVVLLLGLGVLRRMS